MKTISTLSLLILFFFFSPAALCQQTSLLEQGIGQYKAENYEEAIPILLKAVKENPRSSIPAFFLGLSYKQTMDYEQAFTHFRNSVALTPKIKEAVVELIELSVELNRTQEAEEWLKLAEKEHIFPARTAFLKGLLLKKKRKYQEAAASFEKAKKLHTPITQSADFQLALCYMEQRKLRQAEEYFQAVIAFDPASDLTDFARQYQDMLEDRMFLERPFRFTLGIFGQYDTNMVLKPIEAALAADVTDTKSSVMNTVFSASYIPQLKAPWRFNARYYFISSLHQKHATTHDSVSNAVSLMPGYAFGRYIINLSLSYSHAMVRNPNYERYVGSFTSGPLIQRFLGQNHILEFFAGYNSKEYFQPPSSSDEDRDSDSFLTSLNWIWLYRKDAFLNLKYEFVNEYTEGINWSNIGHKFSSSMSIPLSDRLEMQISGEAFLQNYRHTHTSFKTKREDKIYQTSLGFSWEFLKNMFFIPQYTRTRADSNIGIYDYKRDIYSAGIEYKF